jgi:hypothetical protein
MYILKLVVDVVDADGVVVDQKIRTKEGDYQVVAPLIKAGKIYAAKQLSSWLQVEKHGSSPRVNVFRYFGGRLVKTVEVTPTYKSVVEYKEPQVSVAMAAADVVAPVAVRQTLVDSETFYGKTAAPAVVSPEAVHQAMVAAFEAEGGVDA